jgi:hypothetical protein
MAPIVDGLEEEFNGRVTVSRLDAAQPANAELESHYGLRGHPAFAVLDAQNQVHQLFFGPQAEETLRQAMAAVAEP